LITRTIDLKAKHVLFLRDVAVFTFTSFGGAQAHMAILLRDFVVKRYYISEEELLELNALAQIMPGPSTTQTQAGIAYKEGGLPLARS
jgi:chromate transporter